MKYIPTLTLTALAAAASAQTAPAAAAPGLNYNTLTISRSTEDFKYINDDLNLTTVTLSNKVAKNIVAAVGVVVEGDYPSQDINDGITLSVGYVHSLASATDLILSVSTLNANTSVDDSQSISKVAIDLGVRHAIASGFEVSASIGKDTYTHEASAGDATEGSERSTASLGVSYAVTKDLSVSAKANWAFTGGDNTESRGVALSASLNY